MTEETCESCRFFKAYPESTHLGFCRRVPPQWVVNLQGRECIFPEVEKYHWCGAHECIQPAAGAAQPEGAK